jgi:small subunit ribosomal protein S2
MDKISLTQLLEAGVHFGHKASRWNPKMFPYIYTEKNNIHIIDLVQSIYMLNYAKVYVELAAKKGKKFLFIGTKRQINSLITKEAIRCNSYYINHRWLGGMLTNWRTLKTRINRLKKLREQEMHNIFDLIPKKDAVLRKKELTKLKKHLNGVLGMQSKPDVAIIIDQRRELTAIKECKKLKIPIISIIDTNCDPDLVDIPIPGNDDAIRSVKLILNELTNSIIKGKISKKNKSKYKNN